MTNSKLIQRILTLLTWRRLFIFIMVTALVWCGVVVALALGIHQYGVDDQAQSADVIVVLGSGLRRDGRPGDALYRRSVWAARLHAQGYADAIICTGGIGAGQRRSEADACREVLMREGVPREVVYLDEQSKSTEENALYAREIIAAQGWEQVILVTDSFHMLRAQWIFEMEGIDHYRSPVPQDWVRSNFYVRHFTREIVALHWQAFKETFNLPFTRV